LAVYAFQPCRAIPELQIAPMIAGARRRRQSTFGT
jgi:hypothetical protein